MSPFNWYQGSLKQLVFIAFLLVLAPIGFMLYRTSIVLEQQLQASFLQTQSALEVSQQNHSISLLTEDIVRTSQQYRITRSDTLLDRLNSQLTSLEDLLSVHTFLIGQSLLNEEFSQVLALIRSEPLNDTPPDIINLSQRLSDLSYAMASRELVRVQEQAKETRQALWLQTALLVLTTLGIMLLLSSIITRPIAELIDKLKSVGQRHEYEKPSIRGPREIQLLNEEIDWLDNHLRELENTKALFLRHISHELKTPLTTLREGADLLSEEVPGPLNARQKHVVSLIQKGSVNLQSLIEQLLDYNRLQSPLSLNTSEINLKHMIASAVARLQLRISEKAIQLHIPENPPSLISDKELLEKVMNNLISNAVYYTKDAGKVSVGTFKQKGCLIIDVENSGNAIPEKDVEHIFEPFFQSHKRTGPLKGTGIGLSIARDASKALNGELTLHTNLEGQVVFRLKVPVETE